MVVPGEGHGLGRIWTEEGGRRWGGSAEGGVREAQGLGQGWGKVGTEVRAAGRTVEGRWESAGQVGAGPWCMASGGRGAGLGGQEERRVIPGTLPLAQAEPLMSPHTESCRVPTLDPLW